MKDETPNRRSFLKSAGGILGLTVGAVGTLTLAPAIGAVCGKTPTQPKGPFYPTGREPLRGFTKDNDLTFVETSSTPARGQVFELEGKILDEACQPIDGALVEIWQACESGRYNHESDPNPAVLDPGFQYFGKATTGADGVYRFRTIVPGAYPAGDGWMRPPHIHFRVMKRGYLDLITQMYFAGEPLNEKDLILQGETPEAQEKLIMTLGTHPDPAQALLDVKYGVWDITLRQPARL